MMSAGIEIPNEQLPSGVYSALENANLTDSVLNSYNDVKLRWIAKEKWTYSIDFDGKWIQLDSSNIRTLGCSIFWYIIFFHVFLFFYLVLCLCCSVADALFNHSQIVLVFHGLDTIAKIILNDQQLLMNPNNMFVRYRYSVRDKLIRVRIYRMECGSIWRKHWRLLFVYNSTIIIWKSNLNRRSISQSNCQHITISRHPSVRRHVTTVNVTWINCEKCKRVSLGIGVWLLLLLASGLIFIFLFHLIWSLNQWPVKCNEWISFKWMNRWF